MGLTKPRAAQIFNLDYKQATRVVTTANITLTGGAPAVVDGVTLVEDDRVLVTAQSTGTQNGLYIVSAVGTGSNGTWVRTSDGNETGEIEAGMIVMVTEGTVYADTQWKLITDNPIVIGTTALTFTQNYSANSISGGTSNVAVYSNANVTISSAGTANVLTVSSTGVVVTGTVSATGNVTGSNVMTGGSVSATGNVTGNYILGNGVSLTGVITSVANINNGTSNVAITAANANVTVSVNGTSNVAVFSNTGAYVTGVVSASGNITGSNANIVTDLTVGNSIVLNGVGGYGTVTTTQFSSVFAKANGLNATSLMQVKGNDGTNGMGMRAVTGSSALIYSNAAIELRVGSTIRDLDTPTGGNIIATIASTGLTVNGVASASGNVTGGNVLTDGLITATGNVTGNYILGNGSQLSGIATNSINSGNSNVVVNGTDGNVTIGINGVANTVEVSPGELTVYGVYSNPKTISSNVVIGSNINSMLIGPIAVDPAGNIFVPTGSTLNII